jgi:hypothetical protein
MMSALAVISHMSSWPPLRPGAVFVGAVFLASYVAKALGVPDLSTTRDTRRQVVDSRSLTLTCACRSTR